MERAGAGSEPDSGGTPRVERDILRRSLLFAFVLPAATQGFVAQPIYILLQGIYAKHTALALAALGTAVLIARVFDAVTDPLIGYLSDAWHRRNGSRKPWIAAGTLLSIWGLWNLYRPAEDVTIFAFTAWYLVTFLGWTMIEVPYRAWSVELSSDYVQRTRIQTWIGFAGMAGTALFFLTPYLGKATGWTSSPEINFEALGIIAVMLLLIMPVGALLALWKVPNGPRQVEKPRESWREMQRAILGNGPLMYFLMAYLVIGLTGGIAQGTLFLYLDAYLGLSESVAGIYLLALPLGMLATPLWGWACIRFEKHRTWAAGVLLMAGAYVGLSLVPPGTDEAVTVSALFGALFFCYPAIAVAAPAILGDIVDYGHVKFGHDHAGLYFSFYTMLVKAVAGLGVAIGLFILGYFGFDATAEQQSAMGDFGMRLTIGYLPAAGLAIMAVLLWRFPINRARHETIVRQLEYLRM